MKKTFLAVLLIATPLFASDPSLDAGPTICRGSDCGLGSRAVAGDFDGDGLDDVLVGNRLFFNRAGAFAAPVTASGIAANPQIGHVADFNGDGMADVIVHEREYGKAHGPDRLLLSNGNGTFTERTDIGLHDTVAAFDVDGDSRLDLIGRQINKLFVFRNKGNGFFEVSQQLAYDYETLSTSQANIAIGDVNGDRLPDLVTAARDHLVFHFGEAQGRFGPAVKRYIGVNNTANDIDIADLNDDGHLDIVFQANGITALFGDGTGRFPTFAMRTVKASADLDAWEQSITVARLFGGAAQIIATLNDGTVVSFSATNGMLRETARTRVDIFKVAAIAGRFRSRTELDLLAGGLTKDQTANIAQLVLATGDVPIVKSATSPRGRSRSIARGRGAAADPFSGRYELEWLIACAPAITSVDLVRDGIFLDAHTDAPGFTVEAAIPGDFALRIRDAEGHEYAGYLIPDGASYVGVLQDYTDSRHTPRVNTCNGQTAIFRVRLHKQ